jgi:hypothetical protein
MAFGDRVVLTFASLDIRFLSHVACLLSLLPKN